MNNKWIVLGIVSLFVSSSFDTADAQKRRSSRSKKSYKKKLGGWPTSQKAAATRALAALEDLDKWFRYYPSKTVGEFKQRGDDAAYVVNQNVAALPEGTVKTKLKSASDGFRTAAMMAEMTAGFEGVDTSKIDRMTADVLIKARQNIQGARVELAKR